MNLYRFILLFVVLLLIPFYSSGAQIPPDLQIITEEYSPLNYVENGTLQGVSVDLMEEALNRMGSDLNRSAFVVLPWYAGYNKTLTSPDTVLFSMARLPQREELFQWAGPIVNDQIVLFIDSHGAESNPLDISSVKVVGLKDDVGITTAQRAGVPRDHLIEALNAQEAVGLVENGTADAWAYTEIAGRRAIDQYAKHPKTFIIGRELEKNDYYYAFNLNTSPDFVQTVNTTIREIRMDRGKTGVSPYEQIVLKYLPVACSQKSYDREAVVQLVAKTAVDIKNNASGTIAAINAGMSPYISPKDPDHYVYVFDQNVTLVAIPTNPGLIGRNMSGLTDALGKPFRDEIVETAKKNGAGWVSYVYSNLNSLGLYYKESYCKQVTGSDGKRYVVGAGRFLKCDEVNA